MKVLITGAGGFLGTRLCQAVTQKGWSVLAIGRSSMPSCFAKIPRLQWIQQDLSVENALAGCCDVDVVYHLAAQITSPLLMENRLISNNELSTFNVMTRFAGPSTKIVYTSTQMVYGDPNCVAVNEKSPLNESFSAYGLSKLHAENWVRYFQKLKGGNAIVLRLTGFVEGPESIIGYFLSCARENRAIELFSMGNICRDYLSVDDAVQVLIQASNFVSDEVGVYNVGSGDAVTTFDLAKAVCDEMKSASDVVPIDKRAPRGNFVFDIQKARKDLGFCPTALLTAVKRYSRERGSLEYDTSKKI